MAANFTPQALADAVNAEFPSNAAFLAFLHIGNIQLQIASLQAQILGAQLTLQTDTQTTNSAIAGWQQQIAALQAQLAGH